MSSKNSADKISEKKCRICFAYVPTGSRKCRFCGYKFKSSSRYFVDKIRRVLRINRAFSMDTANILEDSKQFFTLKEIETLINLDNINILMFLTLDNVTMLDETVLMELGEMLINTDKHYAIIRN